MVAKEEQQRESLALYRSRRTKGDPLTRALDLGGELFELTTKVCDQNHANNEARDGAIDYSRHKAARPSMRKSREMLLEFCF